MFAIIDTETTGGNPAKDRIMEVAVIIHDGEKMIEEYSTLVNPGVPIAPFIKSLTGINDDMVKDAPTFEEIADDILRLTSGAIFVAHNVRFDYTILRNEYRKLGVRFRRKQLCTVKLSRVLFPDQPSYSLGKLSRSLEIPLDGRHRALGDTRATAILFDRMLKKDNSGVIKGMLEEELLSEFFPPNLSHNAVDDLPEDAGLFYLHNEEKEAIYIGKSKNIRKKVINLFTKEVEKARFERLKELVFDISYEVMGSELITNLMELEVLDSLRPQYNVAQRTRRYHLGIFQKFDEDGFLNLRIEQTKDREDRPVIEFTNRKSANIVMDKLINQYQLHPTLCGMNGKYGDVPMNGLQPGPYNAKVKKAAARYQYRYTSFFIIGEGRSHHEQSAVWIERGQYKGYGYFQPEYIENDIDSFKECITYKDDDPDAHRVIRSWLGKRSNDEIIPYE